MNQRFTLTAEHVKLLQQAYVGWQDCETGAPEIDPKRPYGSSDVERDVAGILGWPEAEEERMPGHIEDKARAIHRETETALQVILSTGSFDPGVYERVSFGEWALAPPEVSR